MENGGFDSSDSEGEQSVHSDDEDAELSFESDDEGNFQQNLVKVQNGRNKLAKRIEEVEAQESDDEEEDDYENEEEYDEEADDDDDESDNDAEDESDDIEDESDDIEDESDSDEETPNEAPLPNPVVVEEKVIAPKVAKPKFNLRTKKSPSALQALKTELAEGTKPVDDEEDDEYKNDTSDEEDIRNTVGNIPMHWYDEYKHIGYDWDAKKIIKGPKGDQLDDFLKRMEDPNFWRTVKDSQTGQDIIISEADIELIKRINSQKIPDAAYQDYEVSFISYPLNFIYYIKFIFSALDRLVQLRSGANADSQCSRSQTLFPAQSLWKENCF